MRVSIKNINIKPYRHTRDREGPTSSELRREPNRVSNMR
jgi:hypothetical protein